MTFDYDCLSASDVSCEICDMTSDEPPLLSNLQEQYIQEAPQQKESATPSALSPTTVPVAMDPIKRPIP